MRETCNCSQVTRPMRSKSGGRIRPWCPVIARTAFILCVASCAALRTVARGQLATFAGNAQHTANNPAAAQRLSALHWSAAVDLHNTGESAHYGQPLVTASNTVIVPIRV